MAPEKHAETAAGDELAVVCRRHPGLDGPYWCQDCHGVHEIARPKPVHYEPRPTVPPPWYIALVPEEWPGRQERQRLLRELLGLLAKARNERADWYEWVLERRNGAT